MLLGDVMAQFRDAESADEALMEVGDLALVAALHEVAAAQGDSVGDAMLTLVGRYEAEASDAEWTTLIGAMTGARDPGTVYLRRVLAHARAPRTACGQAHAATNTNRQAGAN